MRTTMDAAGRLVIPAAIRRQAGLRPGMPLDVRWQGDKIEIEPAALPVKLVCEGRLLVAVPEVTVAPMSAETVEETRQALLHEHELGCAPSAARPGCSSPS